MTRRQGKSLLVQETKQPERDMEIKDISSLSTPISNDVVVDKRGGEVLEQDTVKTDKIIPYDVPQRIRWMSP
eukprot:jgi/Bigna1/65750/fgenesh1_kg.126_\